ncbi:MAG: hypothetical protein P8Y63_09810 [Deltaproteobacteria bacterium]
MVDNVRPETGILAVQGTRSQGQKKNGQRTEVFLPILKAVFFEPLTSRLALVFFVFRPEDS